MSSELILILIFVALSLLGSVAEKVKKGDAPPAPPPSSAQRLPDGSVLLGSGRTIPADSPEVEAFWWLPAPASPEESSSETEDLEDGVISMEPVDLVEGAAAEPVETASWMATAQAPRPEPVRAGLEMAEVDWNAEHDRFHRRYVDGQPAPAEHHAGTLAGLRGPGALRRAVIAAEILGPPRSLRPPDER
jgi:hypothetical protein